MASHTNNDNIDNKKFQQQEDQDLDSGFLSSNTVSDPVSAFLDNDSESSAGGVTTTEEKTTIESNQPSTTDNSKSDSGKIVVDEELEMDSAYCDSGMISTNLTNDLSNLTLGRRPEEESSATDATQATTKTANQNEVYFQTNEEGDTLLHLAIILPHPQVSKTLISLAPQPIYLNIQNDVYLAPLHLAVLTSQPTIVRDLIIGGAKPTVRDRHGNTPLHLACLNNQRECIKQLLTPLTMFERSAARGTESFPQNLELWNYEGETCIHLAATHNNKEVIKYLVEAGADINAREGKQGRTILHKACEDGNEPMVLFLLKECRKLDIDAENYAGLTAYQLANANASYSVKHQIIAQELLRHGADPTPLPMDDSDSESEDVPTTVTKMYSTPCPVTNVA